jgi:hypothetical protein
MLRVFQWLVVPFLLLYSKILSVVLWLLMIEEENHHDMNTSDGGPNDGERKITEVEGKFQTVLRNNSNCFFRICIFLPSIDVVRT